MGYRNDSIAISRDMGPLRLLRIIFAFSRFYCHGVPKKNSAFAQFPLCPNAPLKHTNFIFIVVSPSQMLEGFLEGALQGFQPEKGYLRKGGGS